MKVNREDGLLKLMLIVFPLIVLGNTLEFFLVNKKSLKHVRGKVTEVERKVYKCVGDYYAPGQCEKTIIRLEKIKGRFHIADDAGNDAYVEGIEKGDVVDIYVRKWYQFLMTFGAAKDIYVLEKDGVIFYDLQRWKVSNLACIVIFGIFSLFFGVLYILQRTTINQLLKGKRV